ncbi:MAG: tetraacyldisaccharide 4'-kinase [Gammaproteobacteria bacterium]|nr:MAG: tetraacyldisaccharide 4'-kinase [Gammaproteobacteria bacterium]
MTLLEKSWYKKRGWTLLLAPAAGLFQAVAFVRRRALQGRYQGKGYGVPLIVIGNISVGGTGKTPLIIALARQLKDRGIRAGIVSRGYGGNAGSQAMAVTGQTAVEQCGDEALLIARRTGCPVVVCADRVAAVEHLLAQNELDLILSDDGLQHYRMHRDAEIVVIDGKRGLGNGLCLPAGPLREAPRRLQDVDWVVVNGGQRKSSLQGILPAGLAVSDMTLQAKQFTRVGSGETISIEQWCHGQSVHALAGIGNPERFRDTLVALGLKPQLHSFPDHHQFVAGDLCFDDDWPVAMTAKDAVKCEDLAANDCWFLEVEAIVAPELLQFIENKID